ncbi:MAG: c-type cytochrome [Kofleriaceae bacterium]|nr:c-type cytochrome [Kofleriaceae bacterium]
MFRRLTSSLLLVSSLALGGALVWANAGEDTSAAESKAEGAMLYDRYCLACHGSAGDGKGPGAPLLWPQPRDFRSGNYKWRTTASGYPPTDEDLQRTIRFGVPGTSMHAFGDVLSGQQISSLIGVLKSFAPRKFRRSAVALPVPVAPAPDIAKGKLLFSSLGCIKCHGESAKGDGPSAPQLVDDRNHNARPYDLLVIPIRRPHAPSDNRTQQIYLSLLTGLSGSPMPAYQGAAPDADLWAVASYVDTLAAADIAKTLNNSSEIPALAQDLDRASGGMKGGFYSGHGNTDEAAIFGGTIMPQGSPPDNLVPAQASLDAKRCARCHNKQYRDWQGSVHAAAGSPGLTAQLLSMQRRNTQGLCGLCKAASGVTIRWLSRVQYSAQS